MTFETIRTMLVGYARVSTSEQTLDLQKDALEKIGCTKIYSDVVSGAKEERKGLQEQGNRILSCPGEHCEQVVFVETA